MEKGVLVIKTAYSKEDFRIKWNEIRAIYSESLFLISTNDGIRYYGKISSPETAQLKITSSQGDEAIYSVNDILYIKSVDKGFLDRLNAGIDFGFTFTRARNQRQLTTRSRIGYIAEHWSFDAAFNKLVTSQNEIEDIVRGDGNLTAIHFLQKDWFTLARMEYLYNTEQLLDLRLNTMLGAGKFLSRTNAHYWRVFGGMAFNQENFSGENMDRQSAEAWVASELNLFDVGDISLLTNIFVFPSITEKDRVRIDYRLDLKYDLPLDFYIKTGLTLNFDNQPFQTASRLDYVWQTTFGWSW